ncbi:CUB domain-containing protein [Flammeovirga sp. SubArs3]|uniref:CUB domain-containing protein n=1 Tax=Flammeovirga sp. SubArs3 TaxID=2995316 RepID=UPI00248C02A0|nr:CUB domain-containing protein [Flammeovirga sp. SubArs3]
MRFTLLLFFIISMIYTSPTMGQGVTYLLGEQNEITDYGYTLKDLGGDENYPINQDMITTLYPKIEGEKVSITFEYFSLEEEYDYLFIYDGTSESDDLIAELDGTSGENKTFTATNEDGALTLVLSSDEIINYPGFVAHVGSHNFRVQLSSSNSIVVDWPYQPNFFDSYEITLSTKDDFSTIVEEVTVNKFTTNVQFENLAEGDYYIAFQYSTDTEINRVKQISIGHNVSDDEYDALTTLYSELKGKIWNDNSNWLKNTDVNTWEGVTVESGKVTGLNLFNQNLSGILPDAITSLTNLKTLNLSSNPQLKGTIPSQIDEIENLEDIDLSYCSFEGDVPTSINELTQLKTLQLEGNVFSTIPIFSVLSLQLDVSHNAIRISGIEDNIDLFSEEEQYNNQSIELTPEIAWNNDFSSFTLSVENIGGVNTTYTWYDESNGVVSNSRNFSSDVIDEEYHCIVSNADYNFNFTSSDITVTEAHATAGVSQNEFNALNDIYDALNGEEWVENTNWKSYQLAENWYGVTVENGHVVEINLNENNLNGEIPSSISKLSYLRVLNISHVQIEELTTLNLPKLEQLYVSNSPVKKIETQSKLTSLKSLVAINSKIQSFESFEGLSSLEKLYIQGNLLSSLPSLSPLSQLDTLIIKDNQLTSLIDLDQLSVLSYFDASNNELSDLSFAENLSFEEFDVSSNQLTFSHLDEVYDYMEKDEFNIAHTSQSIDFDINITFNSSNFTLEATDLGGEGTQYLWYLDEEELEITTSNQYTGTEYGTYKVIATNGKYSDSYEVSKSFSDTNSAPSLLSLSNTIIDGIQDELVGVLSVEDADELDSHNFSVDNSNFYIDGNLLKVTNELNFYEQNSFDIELTVADARGAELTRSYTIDLIPPTVEISVNKIDENIEKNTAIGVVGYNKQASLTLVEGTNYFYLDGDSIRLNRVINFEQLTEVELVFEYTTLLQTEEISTIIYINDVNEGITKITYESNQDIFPFEVSNETSFGTFLVIDPDETDNYTVEFTNNDGFFEVSDGKLMAKKNFSADELENYTVKMTFLDKGGLSYNHNVKLQFEEGESDDDGDDNNGGDSGVTSLEDDLTKNILIYPTILTSHQTLSVKGLDIFNGHVSANVYASTGQLIKKFAVIPNQENVELLLPSLNSGIYIIQIGDATTQKTLRFILR